RHHDRNNDRLSWFVVLLTFTAALGGFLFGYDTGVVSGAMLLIRDDFNLTDTEEEVVVSITIMAAVIASLGGGSAMSSLGRRPVILIAAGIFTVGALVLAFAPSYESLVIGRLIVGLGIGLASLATPVYIAEAAPAHMRGSLVTLNTLLITFGQFVAGMVDGIFSGVDGGWRYMLGLSGVPSLIMCAGFSFLPESPRWLVSTGRHREALTVLEIIRGTTEVEDEMTEMIQSAAAEELEMTTWGGAEAGHKEQSTTGETQKKTRFLDLFRDPPVRRALVLGCGLQALQQLSGINTVMYYSASIYSMAGFSETSSIWLAGFTALSQAVGVCGGLYLIERCGRRFLTLTSLGLVVIALLSLGLGFHLSGEDTDENASSSTSVSNSTSSSDPSYTWLVVSSMVAYLLAFGVGMSSIPWTVNAEIYPMHARSLATGVSTTVNWLGNVLVSATFLSLASPSALGRDGAFWLYGAVGALGWLWLQGNMPETKGRTLEEITQLFVRPGDHRPQGQVVEEDELETYDRHGQGHTMEGGSGE
ncbi:unnamed protein product, partial [Discosporangium mesarthrocarpum]